MRIKAILIWHKINVGFGSLNQRYKQTHEPIAYCSIKNQADKWYGPTNETTVWDIERKGINGDIHPTMKPIECMVRPILNSSEKENIVVDLFLGSGTTLIAAHQTGRICYGCEISEAYCDVILDRWVNFTNEDPIRESGGIKWSELKKQ